MILNRLILCVGIFCLLYYLGMGLTISFAQSMLWLWLLAAAVCFLRYRLVRSSLLTGAPVPLPRWFILAWRICLVLGFSLFFYVESFVISGSFAKAPQELDAIICLGAKVNGTTPSGALNERIDTAAAYLLANPDTLCVASGAQGADEGISEAACIRNGLVSRGIASSRILLEEESTDTDSNLRNSLALLRDAETVGIVTNNFHVYRALKLAEGQQSPQSIYGIPAPCSAAGYLHYAVREFCALVVLKLQGRI